MSHSFKGNGNGEGGQSLRELEKKIAQGDAAPDSSGIKESLVTFQTADGLELHGAPVRVMRHAVFFEMYNPGMAPRCSEVLGGFKIVCRGRTVYSGRAVVRNVVNAGLKVVCEATLNESHWTNADPGSVLQRGGQLAEEFKAFVKEWQKLYKVLPEFKVVVGDMQTFLANLQIWLEQVELGIRSAPLDHQLQLEQAVTHELAQVVIPPINELFEKFEMIARNIEDDQKPAHGNYMRQHLHPLVLGAPFAQRAFQKPLGYAGDYEMVNMIARDGQEGGSLFAKVVNCWFLKQPPAVAHRNRLLHLAQYIEAETFRTSRTGSKARIFNFACGSAVEVQRFLGHSPLGDQVELTLADFNSETLEHAQKAIEDVKERSGRRTPVQFQKKTVHQLIKESLKPAAVGNSHKREYDFIYCAGLFDYLSDHTCKQLMDIFYDWVAPGGLLVATNVEPSNPLRHGMAYLLDWHLIYRTAQDMRALRPDRAPGDAVHVCSDATGVDLFIEVRKPDNG